MQIKGNYILITENVNYLEYIKKYHLKKNKNLQKQIYKIILHLITHGILKPQETLSDIKIADALNISKSPVRESLKRLEQEELIKMMPQSKTFVLPINQEKVESSCKLREVIELLLVSEAVKHITNDDFLILESIIEKQQQAIDIKNYEEFFEYDVAFHYQIAKIAKLLDAWKILQKVNIHIDRVRYLTTNDNSWTNKAIVDHRKILIALKEKNKTKVKREMISHLTRVKKVTDKIFIN